MIYTEQDLIEGIEHKVQTLCDKYPNLCPYLHTMKSFAINCPDEFKNNVLEWVNNHELTYTSYGGMSIKCVMEKAKLPDVFFLQVLKNFIDFQNSGFVDKMICYRALPGWEII